MIFNNGSMSIAVFGTNAETHYFIYDFNATNNHHYHENQKQYVMCLLKAASVEEFNLTDLFIVSYGQPPEVSYLVIPLICIYLIRYNR